VLGSSSPPYARSPAISHPHRRRHSANVSHRQFLHMGESLLQPTCSERKERSRKLERRCSSPDSSPENKAISRAKASPAVYRADTLIEDSLCFTLHSNLRKDTSLRIENSRLNEKSALERRRRTKRRGMDRNLYAYRVKKKENNLKRLHLASPNDRDRSDRLSIIRSFRTRVSSRVSAPLPGLLF